MSDPSSNVTALVGRQSNEVVTVKAAPDETDVQLGYELPLAELRTMKVLYFGTQWRRDAALVSPTHAHTHMTRTHDTQT